MNKVMKAVDIELEKEECEILYKAEQLLQEMFNEVREMSKEMRSCEEAELLSACLSLFTDVTARYNVHVTLHVDDC